MSEFMLWLVTTDRGLSDKWYRLFYRERFNIQLRNDLPALGAVPRDTWGLALIEVCPGGLDLPKEIQTFLSGSKNISAILFSKPGMTSNPEISAFLDSGADDFITSDIDERVLLSKAKAHIRRLLPNLNLARTVVTSVDGNVEAEKKKRIIRLGPADGKNKTLDSLTPKEFEILFALLGSEGHVISREFLMENIWGEKSGHINVETIDKHIETLRHKLGPYGKNIKTVYGTGYVYKSPLKEP